MPVQRLLMRMIFGSRRRLEPRSVVPANPIIKAIAAREVGRDIQFQLSVESNRATIQCDMVHSAQAEPVRNGVRAIRLDPADVRCFKPEVSLAKLRRNRTNRTAMCIRRKDLLRERCVPP